MKAARHLGHDHHHHGERERERRRIGSVPLGFCVFAPFFDAIVEAQLSGAAAKPEFVEVEKKSKSPLRPLIQVKRAEIPSTVWSDACASQ